MINNVLYIIAVIFIIIALLDLFKRKMKTEKKILWVVLIIFLPLIGSIIYYFIGRK